MNSIFDIRRNCVRIKAEIKGRELQFRGSGVLYPLGVDVGYDYILTAQHILKDDRKKKRTKYSTFCDCQKMIEKLRNNHESGNSD